MATVLIVDGDGFSRKLATLVLQQAGHEALAAETAAEGLVMARQRVPDVILVDIPVLDDGACEATRRLLADPATAKSKVVAVIGGSSKNAMAAARRAGCDAYLGRPYSKEDLLWTVAMPPMAFHRGQRPEGVSSTWGAL